ncbi:hypothetical protein F0562_035455 [Nyssa sinensis]|uniref:Bet v I/Major latex protein domain-containing protein n=1 Tax=Nyssa sinensis TaxID=561372 RepID=A0A5J5AD38_9ASTE|nr:hypothetical protein F0562_035455 [Nyssa sinensis]
MKHLIEELNEETYTYKYTLVEGDALKDKFEKISFEVQLEASSDGGTISKMKSKYYTKGGNFSYMKHYIDELNEKTYTYKYTLIEGDALMDKLEKISFEVKLEAAPNGGTISKMTSKYYPKGDFVLTEDEIKAGKEKALGMYKVVEAYLQENPDAYACA